VRDGLRAEDVRDGAHGGAELKEEEEMAKRKDVEGRRRQKEEAIVAAALAPPETGQEACPTFTLMASSRCHLRALIELAAILAEEGYLTSAREVQLKIREFDLWEEMHR
jgi:hypothetical protein